MPSEAKGISIQSDWVLCKPQAYREIEQAGKRPVAATQFWKTRRCDSIKTQYCAVGDSRSREVTFGQEQSLSVYKLGAIQNPNSRIPIA